MSNIHQLFQNTSYDSQTLRVMGDAFDFVAQQLRGTADPEIIAKAILNAAKAGERDKEKLSQAAIRALFNTANRHVDHG